MKRSLSLLLAVIMLITMLPTTVFANRVTPVPSVSAGDRFFVPFTDEDEVVQHGITPIPQLVLRSDSVVTHGQRFRLTFENAEVTPWLWSNVWGPLVPPENAERRIIAGQGVDQQVSFNVRRLGATILEFTYLADVIGGEHNWATADREVRIPLRVEVTGGAEARVHVNPMDSVVNNSVAQTWTIATVGEGATVTMASEIVNLTDGDTELSAIVVDEIRLGGNVDGGEWIELRAPSGFEFVNDNIFIATGAGWSPPRSRIAANASRQAQRTILRIQVPPRHADNTARGSLIIDNVWLRATRDAQYGDVSLRIRGAGVTAQTFLVGVFREDGISFEAEDAELPIILAGRFEERLDIQEDAVETLTVRFEENVQDSWRTTRRTEIDMPEGVRLRSVEINNVRNLGNNATVVSHVYGGREPFGGGWLEVANDRLIIGDVVTRRDARASFDITFWISAAPTFEGPVDLTLTGAAVGNDIVATVAYVIPPVEVEAELTNIQIGFLDFVASDIYITETQAGAILRRSFESHYRTGYGWMPRDIEVALRNVLQLDPRDDYYWTRWGFADTYLRVDITPVNWLNYASVGSVEVIDGDLVIDTWRVRGGAIYIYPSHESTRPSTIAIRNVALNIDRTPPEGLYALRVGGTAIVQNWHDPVGTVRDGAFRTRGISFDDLYQVVTPAPDRVGGLVHQAAIDLNNPNVIVRGDGTAIPMDVAAFIHDGRTMVPVAFVAHALGIPQEAVLWGAHDKTVTITREGRVVQMRADSAIMNIGGTNVLMDTEMQIRNRRSFVPVAWLAAALGIPYVWDPAARTVIFNPMQDDGSVHINNNANWNAVVDDDDDYYYYDND